MKKEVIFYVEGQTEENFVYHVIQPHLSMLRNPLTVKLHLPGRKDGNQGGGRINRSFALAESELRNLLKKCHKNAESEVFLTTMLDLYAIAPDTPGRANAPANNPQSRVAHIEKAISQHFGSSHLFFPYLQLHEFEAMTFANMEAFEMEFLDSEYEKPIQDLRDDIGDTPPEEVNEGYETAPSKRILKYIPGYTKTVSGIHLINLIGLTTIRERCPHFDAWLQCLELLGA